MEPNIDLENESFWSKLKNNFIELIEFVAIVLAVLISLRFFVAEPHKVFGSSMVPNFHDGDYIITNKLAVKFGDLQRGEVIILKNPRNQDQVFIKRIIGLPGEHIQLLNQKVYVNNKELNEPYLPTGLRTPGEAFLPANEELTIPEGQYFVMGDNRGASSDSREWGPISKDLIVGQALLRYWPAQKFKLIKVEESSK